MGRGLPKVAAGDDLIAATALLGDNLRVRVQTPVAHLGLAATGGGVRAFHRGVHILVPDDTSFAACKDLAAAQLREQGIVSLGGLPESPNLDDGNEDYLICLNPSVLPDYRGVDA